VEALYRRRARVWKEGNSMRHERDGFSKRGERLVAASETRSKGRNNAGRPQLGTSNRETGRAGGREGRCVYH